MVPLSFYEELRNIIHRVPDSLAFRYTYNYPDATALPAKEAIISFLESMLQDHDEMQFLFENWELFLEDSYAFDVKMEEQNMWLSMDLLGPLSGDWSCLNDSSPEACISEIMYDGPIRGG